MKNRHTFDWPDPLTMLVMLTILWMILSTTVGAQESFLNKPSLTDLQDGDVTLASDSHGTTDVHMSFSNPPPAHLENHPMDTMVPESDVLPEVFLSLRLHW